jgi:hypothetical protein
LLYFVTQTTGIGALWSMADGRRMGEDDPIGDIRAEAMLLWVNGTLLHGSVVGDERWTV